MHTIYMICYRGKYIYDIKSISLLDGEYGKPIYRYDTVISEPAKARRILSLDEQTIARCRCV